ncbi:DUF6252 family protein [Mesonia sp. K7]|uniref:DUF6252 family protein n=1 Tax=Mesonia sp. K7 TaxID=2218606 RepID=UPI000DA792FC|nr:DUF6252 family protein [Mesonia sp. K7]PZD78692.1 hypothetical protein DNG35_04370 [Mesonia sp. K7]
MKKLLYLCLSLTFLVSCSSSDDGGSGGSAAEGTIEASVNGSAFNSLSMTSFASLVEAGGTTSLVIQGNDADGRAVHLMMHSVYEGPGTYEINGDEGNVMISASYIEIDVDMNNPQNSETTTWVAPFEGGGLVGEIQVSEDEGEYVKGTFFFEARNQDDENDTVNVTSGSFNVKKQ